jgi:hypothetical protein
MVEQRVPAQATLDVHLDLRVAALREVIDLDLIIDAAHAADIHRARAHGYLARIDARIFAELPLTAALIAASRYGSRSRTSGGHPTPGSLAIGAALAEAWSSGRTCWRLHAHANDRPSAATSHPCLLLWTIISAPSPWPKRRSCHLRALFCRIFENIGPSGRLVGSTS